MPSPGRLRRALAGAATSAVAGASMAIGLPAVAGADSGAVAVAPAPKPAVVSAADATREAQLVATEDNRLHTLLSTMNHKSGKHAPTGPQVQQQGLTLTIVLPPRAAAYSLDDLKAAAPNLIQDLPDGRVLLTASVLVAPGARLTISPSRPLTLLLQSGQDGFVSIVGWGGRIDFTGTRTAPITIASWDRRRGTDATDQSLGRSYVREAGGSMNASYVKAVDLGFWSGRTSGFAWTGTNKAPSSGVVTDSTFTGGQYGIFASRTTNMQVYHCRFAANTLDGYAQHHLSEGNVTRDSIATGNGNNGFTVDRGSSLAHFTNDIATYNGHDGFELDGKALARTGSASGADTTNYGNDTVEHSWATNNRNVGILIAGGYQQTVHTTVANSNQDGIVVRSGAETFGLADNQLRANTRFGIMINGGSTGAVSTNVVDGGVTGILDRASTATISHNTVTNVTMHAISLQAALGRTHVDHNTVSGHGLTAIDYKRVTDPRTLSFLANDTSGWVQLHRVYPWYHIFQQHPLLVLWSFIIAVPLILGGLLRRRAVPHPYTHTTRWKHSGAAAGTVPVGRPAGPGRDAADAGLPAMLPLHIELPKRARVSVLEPS